MFNSIQKKLVFSFLAITLLSVTLTTWYSFHKNREHYISEVEKQSHDNLVMIAGEIISQMERVKQDILFLNDLLYRHYDYANASAGVNIPPQEAHPSMGQIQRTFAALATNHHIYRQLRYLDRAGNELIRVDYNDKAVIISEEALQNKSHRYYVKEAMTLKKGEIYISPMDLNVDQGVIKKPYAPTIRFATPVYDREHAIKGIIVLNVRADFIHDILEKNRSKFVALNKEYYLVNDRGYFLYHPEKQYQFGFMKQNGVRLMELYPDLATICISREKYKSPPKGFLETPDALFSWHHIFFTNEIAQTISYGINGTQPKGLFYTDKAPEKMQWTLIASTDSTAPLTIFNSTLTELVCISISILALCAVATILIWLNLAKPLLALSTAVKKIRDGDLSARATVNTNDEIGALGSTINTMAAELEQTLTQCQLSEEKYRQLFENAKDGLFVTDQEGRMLEANAAFKTMLHGNNGGLHNTFFSEYFADPDAYKELHQMVVVYGFTKNFYCDLVIETGAAMHCLITVSSVRNEHGEITKIEGAIRDITKRVLDLKQKRKFTKLLNEEIVLAEHHERKLLGQVLHDDIAQDLALIKMNVEEATRLEESTDRTPLLQQSETLLAQTISKIRNIIFDIYPVMLEAKGLAESIEWYNTQFSEKIGVPILFDTNCTALQIKKPHQVYLFRAYKELLTNCFKHADASEIVVTLRKTEKSLVLVVNDDGKGFDTEEIFEISKGIHGIGLFSIKEWAESAGGQLTIESQADQGTRVIIEITINGE